MVYVAWDLTSVGSCPSVAARMTNLMLSKLCCQHLIGYCTNCRGDIIKDQTLTKPFFFFGRHKDFHLAMPSPTPASSGEFNKILNKTVLGKKEQYKDNSYLLDHPSQKKKKKKTIVWITFLLFKFCLVSVIDANCYVGLVKF